MADNKQPCWGSVFVNNGANLIPDSTYNAINISGRLSTVNLHDLDTGWPNEEVTFNIGDFSTAIGPAVAAEGVDDVALGNKVILRGTSGKSTAVGSQIYEAPSSTYNIILGRSIEALSGGNLLIGDHLSAASITYTPSKSVLVGSQIHVKDSSYNVGIGYYVTMSGYDENSADSSNRTWGQHISIGQNAASYGYANIVMGYKAQAGDTSKPVHGCVIIGQNGINTQTLGYGNNIIAIGQDVQVNNGLDDVVGIGSNIKLLSGNNNKTKIAIGKPTTLINDAAIALYGGQNANLLMDESGNLYSNTINENNRFVKTIEVPSLFNSSIPAIKIGSRTINGNVNSINITTSNSGTSGINSIYIGGNKNNSLNNTVVIGYNANVSDDANTSLVLGNDARAYTTRSILVGNSTKSLGFSGDTGSGNIAIGFGSKTFGGKNISIGYQATIGQDTHGNDILCGINIGNENNVQYKYSTAIGTGIIITQTKQTILGQYNDESVENVAFAIGNGSSNNKYDKESGELVEKNRSNLIHITTDGKLFIKGNEIGGGSKLYRHRIYIVASDGSPVYIYAISSDSEAWSADYSANDYAGDFEDVKKIPIGSSAIADGNRTFIGFVNRVGSNFLSISGYSGYSNPSYVDEIIVGINTMSDTVTEV